MSLAVAEREAPTLSVVIPVYNAEPYLDECLSSVLESSFEDLEVICVNDGSTDGSPDMLESFARKDPRVSVIHQENQGVGMARNAGIRAARGTFIHLLDADDWVERDAYGPWCALASRHDADICECLYEYVDAATRKTLLVPTDWGIPEGEDELVTNVRKDPRLLIPGHVAGWNKLYSRAFLLSNDIWFEDLPCAENRAFYYQALLRAQTYVRGSERWVFHRMNNPNSLDGGELRLRNFEVEFRSFESIWAMAQNESPELRIRLLDSCIGSGPSPCSSARTGGRTCQFWAMPSSGGPGSTAWSAPWPSASRTPIETSSWAWAPAIGRQCSGSRPITWTGDCATRPARWGQSRHSGGRRTPA